MPQPAPARSVGSRRPADRFEAVRLAPVTYAIAAVWVLVYLLMVWAQGAWQAQAGNLLSGGISPRVAEWFGAVSSSEVLLHQPWRAITATFLHFGLIHIGFNLMVLIQLGRLIEPWYGAGGFLFVYAVIAWVGYVLASAAKWYFGFYLGLPIGGPVWAIPSAGGSVVLCGWIALIAVVGWRSGTHQGSFLKAQMVGSLVFIGLFGLLVPGIDNFGHAGGAIAGAAIAFTHRRLIRIPRTRTARVLGAIGLAAILLSVGLQVRSGLVERAEEKRQLARARNVVRDYFVGKIDQITWNYGRIADLPRSPFLARAFYLQGLQLRLAADLREFVQPDEASSKTEIGSLIDKFRELAAGALKAPPTRSEIVRFAEVRSELTRVFLESTRIEP